MKVFVSRGKLHEIPSDPTRAAELLGTERPLCPACGAGLRLARTKDELRLRHAGTHRHPHEPLDHERVAQLSVLTSWARQAGLDVLASPTRLSRPAPFREADILAVHDGGYIAILLQGSERSPSGKHRAQRLTNAGALVWRVFSGPPPKSTPDWLRRELVDARGLPLLFLAGLETIEWFGLPERVRDPEPWYEGDVVLLPPGESRRRQTEPLDALARGADGAPTSEVYEEAWELLCAASADAATRSEYATAARLSAELTHERWQAIGRQPLDELLVARAEAARARALALAADMPALSILRERAGGALPAVLRETVFDDTPHLPAACWKAEALWTISASRGAACPPASVLIPDLDRRLGGVAPDSHALDAFLLDLESDGMLLRTKDGGRFVARAWPRTWVSPDRLEPGPLGGALIGRQMPAPARPEASEGLHVAFPEAWELLAREIRAPQPDADLDMVKDRSVVIRPLALLDPDL